MKLKLFAATAILGAVVVATAAAATTLTLAASATSVVYGKPVTLTGTLSTHKANQPVQIVARDCTNAVNKVATVKTTANGAYSASVTPSVAASYQASQKRVSSNTVSVTVTPVVNLKRIKRGSFTATVTAGRDLKGKVVLFQRYAKLRKRWVQVKKVTLTASAPGTKPTVVSSASFKAKAPRQARVRLLLSKTQAAPCYAAATSNVVRN
jgi:hypothetical protein